MHPHASNQLDLNMLSASGQQGQMKCELKIELEFVKQQKKKKKKKKKTRSFCVSNKLKRRKARN